MNKFFASLLCCSLTLPLILQAEQTPSQKKFTRKQIATASKETKTPHNNQPKQKAAQASTPPPQQKKSTTASKTVITNAEKRPQKSTPRKNFYSRSPQVFLAAADDPDNTTQKDDASATTDKNCDLGPNSFRFSMSHREGKGIGYDQGYTSLDMFFMFSTIGNVRPFFDLRGHMTNNGKPAANFGFGVRYLPDSLNAIFGLNTFFDFRQARHSIYEQLGVGLEILGTQWNLHANGYFPIIKTSNNIGKNFFEFQGHRALIHLQSEVAMTGCDVSIGRSLVHRGYFDLDAYLGGYYFQGHQDLKAPGAYLKLTSSLSRFFSVDLQGSYDTLFKSIFQGAASLHIPLGKRVKTGNPKRSCYQETALARNFTNPVARFEMIVTHLHEQTTLGLDPRTGLPINIVFVNNTAVGGNGTVEAPFSTLALAEANSAPGDMIFVYSGDGTNAGMNAGITLQNSQWLQSGLFSFDLLTSEGPVLVPAQSNQYPLITSPGDGVTLANNNIVSGFHIAATSNNIIGIAVDNLNVNYNLLTGASYDIKLLNASGNISIANNTSNSGIGFAIDSPGIFELDIFSNNFNNSGSQNIFINTTAASQSSINIEDNIIQNSSNGVFIQLNNNSSSTATISGNTINNMTGTIAALNIATADHSNMNANIFRNSFTNSITGISISSANTSTGTYGVLSNLVVDLSSTTSSGITFFSNNSSAMTICLTTNNSIAPIGYFFLNNTASAVMNVQSPNLQESGVQAINSGIVETSGTINYIPFNPPSI